MIKGTQLKVKVPEAQYKALKIESREAGVTVASLIRLAIKERYEIQRILEDALRTQAEQ